MQLCQPLVLIFQFLKISKQTTSPPLSLNPGSVPEHWFKNFLKHFMEK